MKQTPLNLNIEKKKAKKQHNYIKQLKKDDSKHIKVFPGALETWS